MNKPLKTITNPMTLIAIFATLSETSAAISLPFLDDQDRKYYLWFLISFPFYLLLLFFVTLNFNYRSLYSPSDFRKNKHFVKTMDDSACRDKRVLRRLHKIKRWRVDLQRGKHDPQRVVLLVRCPSEPLIEINRAKRSKQATGQIEIVVYIIMYNRDRAGVVPDG
ncbi:hypothetical protein LOY67_21455 [Pseudomonas sp. B21-056]|jgi:hypothetical protein|uniref:hypothetical protein n=1 Tax=Pseudomonas sp. B21-056 TaxID=2895495 RepID=UPI0022325DA8|nr:hypothetical protein [Pseudomonas sp. B21-056]UZE22569.1 hypothetical protein LOY67_21455 [Pseudomonas sp. B21-056]